MTNFSLDNLFSTFRPYEKAILSSIQANLTPEAKVIFEKQLDKVNKIQRLYYDREVDMYCKRLGKICFDDSKRFPISLEEVKLAKVKISYQDEEKHCEKTINAEVWVVKGYVFSIMFNTSPRILNKKDFEIAQVTVLVDPMNDIVFKEIQIRGSFAEEWFGHANNEQHPITKLYAAASEEMLKPRLKELNAKFPRDWQELVNQCHGFQLGNVSVYGPFDLRQISLEEIELVVLAEGKGSNILALNASYNDGHVYFVDCADDVFEPKDYGTSFKEALIRYLNE